METTSNIGIDWCKLSFGKTTFELFSFTKDDGSLWMRAKPLVKVLGYSHRDYIIRTIVSDENKAEYRVNIALSNLQCNEMFINETGLFQLIIKSKLVNIVEFQVWVTTVLFSSLRKLSTQYQDKIGLFPQAHDQTGLISELLAQQNQTIQLFEYKHKRELEDRDKMIKRQNKRIKLMKQRAIDNDDSSYNHVLQLNQNVMKYFS